MKVRFLAIKAVPELTEIVSYGATRHAKAVVFCTDKNLDRVGLAGNARSVPRSLKFVSESSMSNFLHL